VALNNTLDQMDLTDIFRKFYPKTTEYTFFSSSHGTISKIDHIDHKTNFNTSKKIEIMSCIFSNYNTVKLEIKNWLYFKIFGSFNPLE